MQNEWDEGGEERVTLGEGNGPGRGRGTGKMGKETEDWHGKIERGRDVW